MYIYGYIQQTLQTQQVHVDEALYILSYKFLKAAVVKFIYDWVTFQKSACVYNGQTVGDISAYDIHLTSPTKQTPHNPNHDGCADTFLPWSIMKAGKSQTS